MSEKKNKTAPEASEPEETVTAEEASAAQAGEAQADTPGQIPRVRDGRAVLHIFAQPHFLPGVGGRQNDGLDLTAQRIQVDLGPVALNDLLLLQPPHALGSRRDAHIDLSGQRLHCNAAIPL